MNPARFKHRIELFRRTLTVDEMMQEIEKYESWGKLWAAIKTIKGTEYIGAAQEKQNKTTRFIVRHSKSLEQFLHTEKTSFEIIYKGVTYDVKDAMNDDEMNITVTIIAEGRV